MKFLKFIIFFIIITSSININAQNILWGFKGGVNIGTPYTKPTNKSSGYPALNPQFGVFIIFKSTEKLYFQIESLYSMNYL